MLSTPPAAMYSASRSVSPVCGPMPKKPFGALAGGFAEPAWAPRNSAVARQASSRMAGRRRFIELGKVAVASTSNTEAGRM
jgi:hypothetical protein